MFLKEILLIGKVTSVNFNTKIYTEFIKYLYCPKMFDPSTLTFEEVRQMSIQLPISKSKEVVRNAQLWMPPKSVIERLSRNVSSLINYYYYYYAKDVQSELKICEEDLMQKMNAAKKKSTKRKIPRTPQ